MSKVKKDLIVDDTIHTSGFKWKLYKNDLISNTIRDEGVWEEWLHSVFEANIDKENVVLDIGANIGAHTLKMSSLAKQVHSFEPFPTSNALLNENISLNNITNVTTHKFALGNESCTSNYLWVSENNFGAAGLQLSKEPRNRTSTDFDSGKDIEVSVTTLDQFCKRKYIEEIHLIKMDVEGMELDVLLGGIDCIKKYKPIIVMEIWGGNPFGSSKAKLLKDLGYNMMQIKSPDYIFAHPDRPACLDGWADVYVKADWTGDGFGGTK